MVFRYKCIIQMYNKNMQCIAYHTVMSKEGTVCVMLWQKFIGLLQGQEKDLKEPDVKCLAVFSLPPKMCQ